MGEGCSDDSILLPCNTLSSLALIIILAREETLPGSTRYARCPLTNSGRQPIFVVINGLPNDSVSKTDSGASDGINSNGKATTLKARQISTKDSGFK